MGIFDFVKDAGEKLFGGDDEPEVQQRDLDDVLADKRTGERLTRTVVAMELGIEDVRVKFREGVATITGTASAQEGREKAILLVGNTQGVARVEDEIRVVEAAPEAPPQPEAQMHTVASGDSLSKIAKQYYGDAVKYPLIFEANRPMLKDPNKIYPGQVLRIPPLD